MALDVVAAERLAGAQRRLEVDAGARLEAAEGRPRQRLQDGVEAQTAVEHLDDGQTAAADGDGVADGGAARGRRRLDVDPDALDAAGDGGDPPTLAHDSREHESTVATTKRGKWGFPRWRPRTGEMGFPPLAPSQLNG